MSILKTFFTIITFPIFFFSTIACVLGGLYTFIESKDVKDFFANFLFFSANAIVCSVFIWLLRMKYWGF